MLTVNEVEIVGVFLGLEKEIHNEDCSFFKCELWMVDPVIGSQWSAAILFGEGTWLVRQSRSSSERAPLNR
jgi:hypothetical protein